MLDIEKRRETARGSGEVSPFLMGVVAADLSALLTMTTGIKQITIRVRKEFKGEISLQLSSHKAAVQDRHAEGIMHFIV